MEEVENFLLHQCQHCQYSPCWWKRHRGIMREWCIYHIGEQEVWDDALAKWCRRQLTREINRRLHGYESNLVKPLPTCMRIGVFRAYFPRRLKIHLWDPQFWDKP